MFDHVADFIRRAMVPSEMVVTGVNDQDIPFFDIHPLFNHLAGINLVVTCSVAEIDHYTFIDQEIHF